MSFRLDQHCCQEFRFRPVVTLRNPNPLTLCQFEPFPPLAESTSAIDLVKDNLTHLRMMAILLNDGTALIRGTIVKNDQLEILKALFQDAIDALLQEWRMVKVGYYD